MAVTKRLNWLKWLYPGEAGLQSEQGWYIDKRRNHMKDDHGPGVVIGLEVLETSGTPDLEVHVQVGRAIGGDGEEIVLTSIVDVDLTSYATGGATVKIVAEYDELGTDPYIVPETATSQDKFLQDDPTITTITGAPAVNQIVLAQVVVGNGATQITDAVDPVNPGTNEIDLRYQTTNHVVGIRLVEDWLSDSNLSVVTVGEVGCDFDDIPTAIAYINTLTRSQARQCAIHLFEKQNGQDWTISSAITIPTWTHVVGMGKPTLKVTYVGANVFSMGAGSSMENLYIETDNGWTDTVIDLAGDGCKLRNMTLRYEHNSTKNLRMVDVLSGSDNCVIDDLVILPYSSDDTKGALGLVINGNRCSLSNYRYTGRSPSGLYGGLWTDGDYNRLFDVDIVTTVSGGYSFGISGNYNSLVEFKISGAADEGLDINTLGNYNSVADGLIESDDATPECVIVQGSYNKLSNIDIPDGIFRLYGDDNHLVNSRIFYDNADTDWPLRLWGSRNSVVGCHMDRGGQAVACISPSTASDENIVSGCRCDNTGGVASILNNQATSTDWNLSGNIVDVATGAGNGWLITGEKVV